MTVTCNSNARSVSPSSSRSPSCLPPKPCARACWSARAPAKGTTGVLYSHLEADEREKWRLESRLTEYLHRFDLDEYRSPPPATSSGGERKRAPPPSPLALTLQPDLLLLDEPTNHLDIEGIEQLEGVAVESAGRHFHHPRPRLPRSGHEPDPRARSRDPAFLPG